MEKQGPAGGVARFTAVEARDIRPGPILREELDPLLALWARRLFERVGHLVIPTYEEWELGFRRDAQPQSELLVWEAVARAYESYLAGHPDCDKADAAMNLMLASMLAIPEEGTEETRELQSLYRSTWSRMVSDLPTTRREVFQSLAEQRPVQLRFWSEQEFRQLLIWDDR